MAPTTTKKCWEGGREEQARAGKRRKEGLKRKKLVEVCRGSEGGSLGEQGRDGGEGGRSEWGA